MLSPMTVLQNEFSQPIGAPVPGWSPRPVPPRTPMIGRTCRVEPLDALRHGPDLYAAFREAPDSRSWTYLSATLPENYETYLDHLKTIAPSPDPMPHAIVDVATGRALGLASYLRVDPANGCIEVGYIHYGPRLARRPAATEAMALMMRRAFDELGYRRYEWKCDSLNAPSRAAALRYGFVYEGIFRQAVVYKDRNRDTAWYSITDKEWPAVRAALEAWLAPENFDATGAQRDSLAALREKAARAR